MPCPPRTSECGRHYLLLSNPFTSINFVQNLLCARGVGPAGVHIPSKTRVDSAPEEGWQKVSILCRSPWGLETFFWGAAVLPRGHTNKQNVPGSRTFEIFLLGLGWAVIPAWANRDFCSRGAVFLGRRLPGRHDPNSSGRFPLQPFPLAQCPLDPHFRVSPALGKEEGFIFWVPSFIWPCGLGPSTKVSSHPGGRAG